MTGKNILSSLPPGTEEPFSTRKGKKLTTVAGSVREPAPSRGRFRRLREHWNPGLLHRDNPPARGLVFQSHSRPPRGKKSKVKQKLARKKKEFVRRGGGIRESPTTKLFADRGVEKTIKHKTGVGSPISQESSYSKYS